LRERFDVGTGLVALGAVLLLVSLFVDWFDPSGDAWAVFEIVDIALAGCAIAALVAIVPRYAGLARAMPLIAFTALAIVAVQLVDRPPAARGDQLDAGAWLALGATALMALGATLSAASISVTIDVRGRERRRRSAAIDAREAREARDASDAREPRSGRDADAPPGVGPEDDVVTTDARRGRRRPSEPLLGDDARRPRRPADVPDGDAGAEVAPVAEPDPDRTQAMEPVERPKEGS